jgi:CubicO group peptidase (beta-lactamase class C family)
MIAGMSTALRQLLIRHVDAGTIPGGVALLGAGNVEVVTAGVASAGGGPMGEDAVMRIQSMTKAITSVAAVRLVEAGRLGLDQGLADWLPELAGRQVLRGPAAELAAPPGGTSAGVPAGTRMALSPFVCRARHPHLAGDGPPAW